MEFLPECEIKEECGVFGIFNPDGGDVAPSIYYGLSSLQHRGQESCGIAVCDTMGPKGNMNAHKGMGLGKSWSGSCALLHNRSCKY